MREEIVYSAAPQLADPRGFAAAAAHDLRASPRIAWRLFSASLKGRHRRAALGYLWLVLPALMVTGIWIYLREQRLIDFGPVGMPYPVFVLAGMLLWQLFLDALNAPLAQLGAGKAMLASSRVPLEALVTAGALEAVLNFAIRLALLVPVLFLFGVEPGSSLLLVPLGAAALGLLGLALGLFLAPLGLLYEDVGRGLTLVTGAWFFLTPIVYPAPDGGLVRLNPVTPALDLTRQWLTGGAPDALSGAGVVLLQLALLLPLLSAAWLVLRLARPHLVARLG